VRPRTPRRLSRVRSAGAGAGYGSSVEPRTLARPELTRGYDFEVPESMNATRSLTCFADRVEPKFVGMIPFV
jgi:hypothetical protein